MLGFAPLTPQYLCDVRRQNVCEKVINTLLVIDGKTKDNMKPHLDLKSLGISPSLYNISGLAKDNSTAVFALNKEAKDMFYNILKRVKVWDGFTANISHYVNIETHKFQELKGHGHHIFYAAATSISDVSCITKKC